MSVAANLNADHLALDAWAHSPAALVDVIAAEPATYEIAASAVGLSPSEYAEFYRDLEAGKATQSAIPAHVDAMAGRRGDGRVYALRDVRVPGHERGLRVILRDGRRVYVPFRCGNLAVVNGPPIIDTFSVRPTPQKEAFVPQESAGVAAVPDFTPSAGSAPTVTAAPASGRFSAGWIAPLVGLAGYIAQRVTASTPACVGQRSCEYGVNP